MTALVDMRVCMRMLEEEDQETERLRRLLCNEWTRSDRTEAVIKAAQDYRRAVQAVDGIQVAETALFAALAAWELAI